MVLLKKKKKKTKAGEKTHNKTETQPSLLYTTIKPSYNSERPVTKLKWLSLLSPAGKKNKKYQFSILDNT